MNTNISDLFTSLEIKQDFKTDWAENSKKDWRVDFKTTELSGNMPNPLAPVVDFTADITSGVTGTLISFIETSSLDPISWFWNFGDGATSTLQNPQHLFETPGNFSVTLTATNLDGSGTKTRSQYINIYYSYNY